MLFPRALLGRLAFAGALTLTSGCCTAIVLTMNDEDDDTAPVEGTGGQGGGQDAPDPCSDVNLARDLALFLPFDGDLKDATGHGHDGRAQQSIPDPSATVAFTEGKRGQAVAISGFGPWVSVPDDAEIDLDDTFTISLWVNPTTFAAAAGNNPTIIGKSFSSEVELDGNFVLNVQILDVKDPITKQPAGQALVDMFSVKRNDDTGTPKVDEVDVPDDAVSPHRLPLGTWTHVAATFDHGKLALYIGGELVAYKETDIEHTSRKEYDRDDLMIGGLISGGSNYAWQGALDEARLYGRALDEIEVGCLAKR